MKLDTSRKIIIILGIIITIMPFLGFPSEWKQWMYIVLGTAVVTVTVLSAVPPHLLHKKEESTEEAEEEYNRSLFDEEVGYNDEDLHEDDEREEKNDTER